MEKHKEALKKTRGVSGSSVDQLRKRSESLKKGGNETLGEAVEKAARGYNSKEIKENLKEVKVMPSKKEFTNAKLTFSLKPKEGYLSLHFLAIITSLTIAVLAIIQGTSVYINMREDIGGNLEIKSGQNIFIWNMVVMIFIIL